MAKLIKFTKEDTWHAALGSIPAFLLVALGHLTFGAAFAIGLLPTSLMGIAPTRRLRVVYGIVGCLFGVGILLGSLIISLGNIAATVGVFIIASYVATVIAAKRPAGGLLLSIILPSLAVGTGYTIGKAVPLMFTFMLGSMWSALVTLPLAERAPDKNLSAKLLALQPRYVRTYGALLGLTAATAIIIGHVFGTPYPGWIATAAMLIMRPIQQMTGWRGVGRAVSTIAGTLLVILAIRLGLNYVVTATAVALVAIVTIGAKTSRLYITPFGTAFLILTIELYDSNNASTVRSVGHDRVINNILGALIALFYGLVISWLLEQHYSNHAHLQPVG